MDIKSIIGLLVFGFGCYAAYKLVWTLFSNPNYSFPLNVDELKQRIQDGMTNLKPNLVSDTLTNMFNEYWSWFTQHHTYSDGTYPNSLTSHPYSQMFKWMEQIESSPNCPYTVQETIAKIYQPISLYNDVLNQNNPVTSQQQPIISNTALAVGAGLLAYQQHALHTNQVQTDNKRTILLAKYQQYNNELNMLNVAGKQHSHAAALLATNANNTLNEIATLK